METEINVHFKCNCKNKGFVCIGEDLMSEQCVWCGKKYKKEVKEIPGGFACYVFEDKGENNE